MLTIVSCNVLLRQLCLYLLVTFCLLTGCTSHVPREKLPFPLTSEEGDSAKVVTIPLPVIASSPNEGITAGALTAVLIHNKRDEINTLLAPQVNHNSNFGITASLYGAFYPTPDRYVELNLSQSGKVNHAYEIRARDISLMEKKLELNAYIFKLADGSSRFFGFSAKSPLQQETNYANDETGYNISAGYQFSKYFQVTVGDRLRDVNVRTGAVKKVPFIKDKFALSQVPGIDGFMTHAPRISLSYSTLNNRDTPTNGGYARITFEPTLKVLGGAADYRHYEAEVKGFVPLDEARYISVFRVMYNQTKGENVPFLEQSILGGETTLRGYGRNRFIDNSFFLCNLEERIRLFRWEIFNVTADWELAPFVDLGAVMESLDKANGRNFEFNPGLGIRAVVRPNIVGRVDIGIGKDGPALFVGLGYPF